MNPGFAFARTYLSKDDRIQSYPDTLTIYDRGDLQGFLIKQSTGKTSWIVFQVDYRIAQDNGDIVEGGEILSESEAPFQYVSIETYPLKLEQLQKQHFLFSLPQAQLLVTCSDLSLASLLAQEQQQAPVPLVPSLPQQPRPSPLQQRGGAGPGSRVSPKSGSSKPTGGQHPSQNKNRVSPTSKALSSSNPGSRGQPSTQAPRKQAQHPQQPPRVHHSDRESSESHPWISLAQQSLYSRPPPEVAKEFAAQASASPSQKDSESH